MSTAEELLCSRKWRLRRGLWMLWGWVPFALTAWVGYLTIGIKARNWKWILTAVLFFLFGCAWIWVLGWTGSETDVQKGESMPEPYSTYLNISMWSSILLWLGNAAWVQWLVNRRWLVWRAHNDKKVTTPWYATATATPGGLPASAVDPGRVSAVIDSALADGQASSLPPQVAVSAPALSPTPQGEPAQDKGSASSLVDVNTATVAQLAALPGLNADAAAQLVGIRDQIGGFRDSADLVTRGGMKPHVLAGLRTQIAVVADTDIAPATPPPLTDQGRNAGRRLEF